VISLLLLFVREPWLAATAVLAFNRCFEVIQVRTWHRWSRSDGHWGSVIEQGYIRRLLERLNEIKLEQQK